MKQETTKLRCLVFAAGITLLLFQSGCRTGPPPAEGAPSAYIREAPVTHFRGANSPDPAKPGEVDCNSPAHWDGQTLYIFNSAGHPWRASGPDVFNLSGDYRKCEYSNQAQGGRWIECTWKARDGALYGWYHFEPWGICPGAHPKSPGMSLTAPRIGAVKSGDNGATWIDLGVILDAEPVLRCNTTNYYFAGGNGDFSAMLDDREEYLYFFISTYAGGVAQQGVAVARMPWGDRDDPVGKVSKYYDGSWSEPGLGGRATPIFPARADWHTAGADAFWGPSIHWNSYLRRYVILLNRAIDANWKQEGVYVSFSRDLSKPHQWTAPVKILDGPGHDRWYPQVIGTDTSNKETDKLAGRVARLFVRGTSRWEIVFLRADDPSGNIEKVKNDQQQ